MRLACTGPPMGAFISASSQEFYQNLRIYDFLAKTADPICFRINQLLNTTRPTPRLAPNRLQIFKIATSYRSLLRVQDHRALSPPQRGKNRKQALPNSASYRTCSGAHLARSKAGAKKAEAESRIEKQHAHAAARNAECDF